MSSIILALLVKEGVDVHAVDLSPTDSWKLGRPYDPDHTPI